MSSVLRISEAFLSATVSAWGCWVVGCRHQVAASRHYLSVPDYHRAYADISLVGGL